jgi:hypothetical protein
VCLEDGDHGAEDFEHLLVNFCEIPFAADKSVKTDHTQRQKSPVKEQKEA